MFTITTDSLKGYGLHRMFRLVKQSGFNGIEITINHDYDTQDAEYLLELSKEFDLEIKAISAPNKSSKKSILTSIDIAKTVGCSVLVIQPPELLDFSLVSWIKKEIPKIRKKEKLHICLENSDASTFLGILPKFSMNSMSDLKNFRSICLNTSNLASKKIDLMKIYSKLKGYIKHVHLSNSKDSKSNLSLDNGVLPLESFLLNLKEDNYKGIISLKISPKELQVSKDISKLLERLKQARSFLERYYTSK